MNSNQIAAFKNLEQAQQALKGGDKKTARQLSAQAAQLAPELEEVWLLMAALSSPYDSVTYLEKALRINPQSERAVKGLTWAQSRLQQERNAAALVQPAVVPPPPVVQPPVVSQPPVMPQPEVTAEAQKPASLYSVQEQSQLQPVSVVRPVPAPLPAPNPAPVLTPVVVKTIQGSKAAARPRFTYLALLVVVICLVLAWAGWQGATRGMALFSSSAFAAPEHGPASAPALIAKSAAPILLVAAPVVPTATAIEPSSSISAGLSTLTPTRSPDQTDLPTVTAPVPTVTLPAPTDTLVPPTLTIPTSTATQNPATATPLPTDVIQPTATPAPVSIELPSPTALPTDTAEPGAMQYVPPTPNPNGGGAVAAGRWIDVDLTRQMVYAYEGNTIVNSFLVSTGTWQYPTVTGQYHVYVKYRYTDMSGPGYYLPNVPYTMYFYQGYALHGTYWHSNFGTPMSHGCVNLSIPDSGALFNWASVGTLVNVHY